MSDFNDKLRLKERAEEDIYFAKRSKELIRALHEKDLAERPEEHTPEEEDSAAVLKREYAPSARKHWYSPGYITEQCRKLAGKILKQR